MIGFGEFGKERNLEITSLSDKRLMLIDPTVKGFFDKVLQFETDDKRINAYIDAIREVQEAKLVPFWRPIMDPTEENGKIIYMKGRKPAVGHSYNWWRNMAKKMPAVEGNIWLPGSEYQYYADEVDLINRLVDKKGYDLDKAIEMVVLKSKKLGHYADSEGAIHDLEPTGSREVCGRYDLGNTCKILSCTNQKAGGYWIAGGSWNDYSAQDMLADLCHLDCIDRNHDYSVCWLALRKGNTGH